MGRKRKKILLENVHISDAGAKGKAITRLENGLVLFVEGCLLYTSPSPRDATLSRMPSSA